MKKIFDNILEFSKINNKCIFCNGNLITILTSYTNPQDKKLTANPLNIILENGKFDFVINHTTPSYNINGNCIINAANNKLSVNLPIESDTPTTDRYAIEDTLSYLEPAIGLCCYNKSCKNRYAVFSHVLHFNNYIVNEQTWYVKNIKLFTETFKTKSSIVINNYMLNKMYIYSIAHKDANPIETSIIDFEAMGPAKLINRISTIVTFS